MWLGILPPRGALLSEWETQASSQGKRRRGGGGFAFGKCAENGQAGGSFGQPLKERSEKLGASVHFRMDSTCEMPKGPWDAFKVTAASIRHSRNKTERLVLYNVNVPVHLISNDNVYNVIRDTIVRDFRNDPGIYFQLSAVYTLVNRDTGDLRTWTGSFNPRNPQPNQLTTHRRFEPDTFIDFARANSSIEVVLQRLTANHVADEKTWLLLNSIVFNFQCKLRASHRLFLHRPQLQHVGASSTHKKIEFNLEAD